MTHSEIPSDIAGKHTLVLTPDGTLGGPKVVKVTVLRPPLIHGYRKDGAWSLYGNDANEYRKVEGDGWEPNYVLPVRVYRRRHSTAYWLGFIASIEMGWSP